MQSTNSMTLNFILIDPCCQLNNKTMTPQFIAAESYCDQDISCNYILRVIGNGLSMMTEWGTDILVSNHDICVKYSSRSRYVGLTTRFPWMHLDFQKVIVSLKSNFDKKPCDSIEICFDSRCQQSQLYDIDKWLATVSPSAGIPISTSPT